MSLDRQEKLIEKSDASIFLENLFKVSHFYFALSQRKQEKDEGGEDLCEIYVSKGKKRR